MGSLRQFATMINHIHDTADYGVEELGGSPGSNAQDDAGWKPGDVPPDFPPPIQESRHQNF